MSRRRRAYPAIALLVLAVVAPGQARIDAAEPAKPIAWTFSHCCSPNTGWGTAVQVWAERIKQESNGRIVITIYPNGQLSGGNQQKEIGLIQAGDIQAGVIPFVILSTQEPKFNIPSLPFAVPNNATGNRIMAGPEGKKLLGYVEPKGLKGLAVASAGFRQFLGRTKPLLTPADFKNVKIRVQPGEMASMIFKQLGADPVVMNYADVYTALQQKALDAIEMPASFILNDKFHEVAKHITVSNYQYQPVGIVANQNAWNALAPADQGLVQKISDEIFAKQRQDVDVDDRAALEKLKALGVTVTVLGPDQMQAFREKMKPVYDLFTQRYGTAVTEFLNAK